jgi:hypothetical protein
MDVEPGDTLHIEMSFSGSQWIQRVRKSQKGRSIDYVIDLRGQAQHYAYFDIELGDDGGPHVADVEFTDTTISFAEPDPDSCVVRAWGPDDRTTRPKVRRGGSECFIQRIVLKSKFPPTKSDPSCQGAGGARSRSSRDPATIAFKNERGLPVRLCWIDYEGHRRQCRTLANGETQRQSTFFTHPWIVTDLSDTCIGLFWPSGQAREHVIR